jgi:hypothetical protein
MSEYGVVGEEREMAPHLPDVVLHVGTHKDFRLFKREE